MKIKLTHLANLRLPYYCIPYTIRNLLSRYVTMPEESPPAFSGEKLDYKPCVIITHDVDTKWGFEKGISYLMEIEKSYNLSSTFFIVANSPQYRINHRILSQLTDNDFEIGCHGLFHDCRLPFLSDNEIFHRLLSAKEILEQMGANQIVSFRAPWLITSKKLIPNLIKAGYLIDSSLYVPSQPFPFAISSNALFEFPLTIFQDYYLINKLKMSPQALITYLFNSSLRIYNMNGVALINLHADKYDLLYYLRYYESLIQKIIETIGKQNILSLNNALHYLKP